MTHPACRLNSGLWRSNGCPLDREEDCDLCCVEVFEKWHCHHEPEGTEALCPPEGCALGQCARMLCAPPAARREQ
jgi:hypothetical protein